MRRADGPPRPVVGGFDKIYFDSYAHLSIHEEMIKDRVRTETYRRAILTHASDFEGKVRLRVTRSRSSIETLSFHSPLSRARLCLTLALGRAYCLSSVCKQALLEVAPHSDLSAHDVVLQSMLSKRAIWRMRFTKSSRITRRLIVSLSLRRRWRT